MNDETALSHLVSKQHTIVHLELLGQAFGLDVEDESIIKQVTDLYKQWLLSEKRPQPLKEDEQYFWVEMLKHMSLLFTPRDHGNVDVHAKLCSVVLDIFEAAARDIGPRFTQDSWESLMKVVMGICDHLLQVPENTSPLANALCPQLLKVLVAVWVRSGTQNNDIWDKLKELMFGWRHRLPVILQWVATCTGFTNCVLKLLYVYPEPKPTVIFQSMGTSDLVQLDQGYVFYSWYRMLHILGDLETLQSPQIYLEAMKGVHQLVRPFYQGLSIKLAKIAPPDGNSILHLFGAFLVDAINTQRPGFDEGKAEAFQCMLSLFIDKSTDTDFDPTYLAMLYSGIQQAILSQSKVLLDVIVNNSSNLFQTDLRGIRVLVPAMWFAVNRILRDFSGRIEGGKAEPEELRRSCYHIASYLLGLPHFYGTRTFGEVFENTPLFEAKPNSGFNELYSLRKVLLTSLLKENDDSNKTLLLCILLIHSFEDPSNLGDFAFEFVKSVAEVMIEIWNPEVISFALQTFTDLSLLYHHLSESIALLMVNSLCDYVEILVRDRREDRKASNELLIMRSLQCITAWMMRGQWLVREQGLQPKDRTLLHKLLIVTILTMTGRVNVTPNYQIPDSSPPIFTPSPSISASAKFLLLHLLNNVDYFPTTVGPTSQSSLKTEEDVLQELGLSASNLKVFILDNNKFLSVIWHPRDSQGLFKCSVIVRDVSGRFLWHSQSQSIIPEAHNVSWEPLVHNKDILATLPPDPFDAQLVADLLFFLNPEEKDRHARLQEKIYLRTEAEGKVMPASRWGQNVDTTVRSPELPGVDDATPTRILFTNMGLNSIPARSRLFGIKDPETFSPQVVFRELDAALERSQVSIGVVYIKGKNVSELDIFTADVGSPNYEYILENLGWEIDLGTHIGFNGGLNPKATGQKTRYYAEWDTEIAFHVATLMPYHSQTAQQYKRRLLMSDKVLIVFSEAVQDLGSYQFIKDSGASLIIGVSCFNSQLYRIQMIQKKENLVVGPLVDDAAVTKHALPSLLRQTAVNAFLADSEAWKHKPMMVRQHLIDDLVKKHKAEANNSHTYFSSLF